MQCKPLTTTTMIRTSAGHLRLNLPRPSSCSSPLLIAANQDPSAIDALLVPHLLDPDLPAALAFMLEGLTHQTVTPPHLWGGDPTVPRNVYITSFVHATVLGRAFALLNTPVPAPARSTADTVFAAADLLPDPLKQRIYAHYKLYDIQRRRLWSLGLAPLFSKGLLSGPDPAPAARFYAAILILACWRALAAALPPVRSVCGEFFWYHRTFKDGPACGLEELASELEKTAALPRENWNVGTINEKTKHGQVEGESLEYVPVECFHMLSAARAHVAAAENESEHRDYTSAELNKLARDVLQEAEQTARSHTARINWDDYLGLAFNDWKQSDKQWATEETRKGKPGGKKGKGKKSV
ncbi:hypothetical protein B0H19DRAFT_1154054 [Mycena capillaripes]|nr:hypothetical protein B0H19DRAFT_1154054 [Mycena capillaripes]